MNAKKRHLFYVLTKKLMHLRLLCRDSSHSYVFHKKVGASRAPLVGSGPRPGVQPFLRFPTKVPPEARPSPPAQIPIG